MASDNAKNALNKKVEQQSLSNTEGNAFEKMITAQLTKQYKAISSLVPKHVTPERLCRIGLNAISRNPKLMECAPETLVGSIVNCASLGLEPNLLGHAYIVPFFNGRTKRMEAEFQIGYKGCLDLVRRTGQVSTISAHEVYDGDVFEYAYGLDEKLIHIPNGEDDENKITHFYACYKLKDGGTGFVVMSRKQMDSHRDKFTKSKDRDKNVFGPWVDHYVSMALKTVIIKLIKYMPISIEQQETQTIMEGIARDNTSIQIKESSSSNFGEAWMEADYTVDETTGEVITENKEDEATKE